MIKKLRMWFMAVLFVSLAGGSSFAITAPTSVSAAGCSSGFLTFPTWYDGISKSSGSGSSATCEITSPSDYKGGIQQYILRIILNVVDIMLQVVGYISVGFLIYGGYLYMIGAGSPDRMTGARKTIINAVVGLVISFFSVLIVNVIAGRFS